MICKSIERTIAIGDKRLDYKKIIFKVIKFLDEHIEGFPQHLSNSIFDEENEKRINEMLSAYLNYCISDFYSIDTFRFSFIKDTSIESTNYNPDIGVMLGNKIASTTNSFFHIECKRLPARDKKAEREYVEGKLGGIQRFKEDNHGKGLNYSAIVGYVQSDSLEYWYLNVNSWIDELITSDNVLNWNADDKLSPDIEGSFQRFTSLHQRKNDPEPIKLFHYWVSV